MRMLNWGRLRLLRRQRRLRPAPFSHLPIVPHANLLVGHIKYTCSLLTSKVSILHQKPFGILSVVGVKRDR